MAIMGEKKDLTQFLRLEERLRATGAPEEYIRGVLKGQKATTLRKNHVVKAISKWFRGRSKKRRYKEPERQQSTHGGLFHERLVRALVEPVERLYDFDLKVC